MAGPGTVGETVLANERDNDQVARVLGLKQVRGAAAGEPRRALVLRANRELGRRHGLEYAEAFHYVGPNALGIGYSREEMDAFIQRHAVPLGVSPGSTSR